MLILQPRLPDLNIKARPQPLGRHRGVRAVEDILRRLPPQLLKRRHLLRQFWDKVLDLLRLLHQSDLRHRIGSGEQALGDGGHDRQIAPISGAVVLDAGLGALEEDVRVEGVAACAGVIEDGGGGGGRGGEADVERLDARCCWESGVEFVPLEDFAEVAGGATAAEGGGFGGDLDGAGYAVAIGRKEGHGEVGGTAAGGGGGADSDAACEFETAVTFDEVGLDAGTNIGWLERLGESDVAWDEVDHAC